MIYKVMRIFQYSDYVQGLKAFFQLNDHQIGIKTQFADQCGCKLSYISQVLKGDAHFTMDHAYGAANFMRLNDDEQDYFLTLVQHARAASGQFRVHLEKRLTQLKSSHFTIEKNIGAKNVLTKEEYEVYASDWLLQAIHVFLTIPKFQSVQILKERLNISSNQLQHMLEKLERLNLVRFEKKTGRWIALSRDMHAKLSPSISSQRHLQWKMRAINDMQLGGPSAVHYSSTFSLSSKDFDLIKSLLISFIAESRATALKSEEELASHLDISFFEI